MNLLELHHANTTFYLILIFKIGVLCPKFSKSPPLSPQTHTHNLTGELNTALCPLLCAWKGDSLNRIKISRKKKIQV